MLKSRKLRPHLNPSSIGPLTAHCSVKSNPCTIYQSIIYTFVIFANIYENCLRDIIIDNR